MSDRASFAAAVTGGTLGGWVVGRGRNVLLLHGGPGFQYEYMEAVADELEDGYRVASFQQRGLAPSTLEGPFTISQAINDVAAVLDALEWRRALLVGHSWGGHLAFRVAAAHPERLLGFLAIDPLGIVGDGGSSAFEAELYARTPKEGRARLDELREQEKTAEPTPEEKDEFQAIIWPAYFADPESVMPRPPTQIAEEAFKGLIAEVEEGTEEVAAALGGGEVPYGVLAGAASPFPWGQAARASVELSPTAFLKVVPNAGHFVWYEAPGSVRAALDHLSHGSQRPERVSV
ncbi:MAG TPA: alpha/beta hydrolase [Solirubrobacteraceae bacterium]|nr:alpha/beta hydrolase [Solirubrobacteraceae bacterium]